jgi:hypothetical protein
MPQSSMPPATIACDMEAPSSMVMLTLVVLTESRTVCKFPSPAI